MAKRSLKTRFPGFGTVAIRDKRGLGYYLDSLDKRLSIDPVYLDELACYIIENTMVGLTKEFFAKLITDNVESRGGYIRGNAYPVAVDREPFYDGIVTALTTSNLNSSAAAAIAPVVYLVLTKLGLWTFRSGQIQETEVLIENTYLPLLTGSLANNLQARVLFAHCLKTQIAALADRVAAYIATSFKGGAGKPNVKIDMLAYQLHHMWKMFCVEILARKRVFLEIIKATTKVIAWALKTDDYVPVAIKEDKIQQFLTYANVTIGNAYQNYDGGAPTQSEELRFETGLEEFRGALSQSSSLWETHQVLDLATLFVQYEVRTDDATDLRSIHVTEWYFPKAIPVALAYMPEYVKDTNTYFVRPCPSLAESIAQCMAPLAVVSKQIEEKWERTSSAYAMAGANWINHLDVKPYADANFCDAVVRMLACSLARTVKFDGALVYEVNGWEDSPIGPASGREARYIFETDAYRALCQLPIGNAAPATAYKNPSLLGLVKGDSIVKIQSDTFTGYYTNIGIPLDANGIPRISEARKAQGKIYSLDLQPLQVQMYLYCWAKMPSDVAVEVYMETTLLGNCADQAIEAQLKRLNAIPIKGANSSYLARSLKLELFREIAQAAERNFGALAQQIEANYTGWAPSFWTQGADQAARAVRQQAVLELYTQMLRAFGVSCVDELEKFLNSCIDVFSMAELVGC